MPLLRNGLAIANDRAVPFAGCCGFQFRSRVFDSERMIRSPFRTRAFIHLAARAQSPVLGSTLDWSGIGISSFAAAFAGR